MDTPCSVNAVYHLWDSMTSFEQALFVQRTSNPDGVRLTAGNHDDVNRVTTYDLDAVLNDMSIESAKQRIADAVSVDSDAAKSNLLVELINNKVATLAMLLLTKMATSDDWRPFVRGSLIAECAGGTLLHEVAKHGRVHDLRDFITPELLSNLRPNGDGDTPLHLAAAYGHTKDLELLLANSTAFSSDEKGWTPLHCAVSDKSPSVEIVASLIRHAIVHDPLALDAQTLGYGNTALHLACRNKNADEELLKKFGQADPTICNADRRTPLHLAAERENDQRPITVLLEVFLPRMSKNDLAVNINGDRVTTQYDGNGSNECNLYFKIVGSDQQRSATSVDVLVNNDNVAYGFQHNNRPPKTRRQTLHYGGKSLIDSLLSLCAKNGHCDAVALLLQNGADPKNVLHDIVDESAKRRDKTDQLVAVYKTIVENLMVPNSRWLAENDDDNSTIDSSDYWETRRCRLIELVDEPNKYGKNVIERAIELGAKDLLLAILNTSNVFRFDDNGKIPRDCGFIQCDRVQYDVTNMIQSTMYSDEQTSLRRSGRVSDASTISMRIRRRPAKCYMELITKNENVWREHDILRQQPFKKLSKSYVGFMKRVYFAIGTIQLIYISLLSVYFLPTRCSLNEQFFLNLTDCDSSADDDFTRDPDWGWLIWPVILLAYHLFSFISYVISMSRTVFHLNRERQQYGEVRNVGGETEGLAPKLFYSFVDKFPFWAFSSSAIIWYSIAPSRSDVSYVVYLEVTSMLFLFGWIINFILFCRITKELYVMSLVLKSMIIEDVMLNFAPVFLCVVIAFSFTVYVLQQTILDSSIGLDDTVYEIFATAFTSGNLYDFTIDPEYSDAGGRLGFLKAIYAVYLSLTALILFTYLIAMMSHRYEAETPHAENAWRFDCVADVMQLERYRYMSYVFRGMHRLDYWFWFCCTPNCEQIHTLFGDRYFTTIQRWRPWSTKVAE